MLSVLFNKSIPTDPVLIHDFSRLTPLVSNKLNGYTSCSRSHNANVEMSEKKITKQNEPSRNRVDSNSGATRRYHVPSRASDNRRFKPTEESIFVQFSSYQLGLPIPQLHNNLICGNTSQLSQYYFHRPYQEPQRSLHNSNNVPESLMNGIRHWEKLPNSNRKYGFHFTVMSYNVLAQDLLNQHPQLYSQHWKKALTWNVRWNNLLSEITHFKPDILCLQEVQQSHLDSHFSALEQLGYKKLYKRRTGIRTDGCAIYYKFNIIKLVENTTVEYNQKHVPMLDRDNVAIIAKFSPTKNPKKAFVVATTHLLYNPKREDVRLAQTQLLLTEIDRIAYDSRTQYLPVILTGDLNATPDSAVYKLITKGKLAYENLSSRSLQPGVPGPRTGKKFLPPFLGITDQCQHVKLVAKRQDNTTISRTEELELIELKHSERQQKETKNSQNSEGLAKSLFSSGTLSHNLKLKSVYEHHVNGDIEGTTYQNEWVSVDYIFFSQFNSKQQELIPLERYRLPTKKELGDTKIPNSYLGSDHLSLLAKFQLRL